MDKELKKEFQKLHKKLESFATKDDLAIGLAATESRLKQHAEGLQEELARMVKGGFDDVFSRLDVKDKVVVLERKINRIETALHVKL